MSDLLMLVKYVCAVYLIWLGASSLRLKPKLREMSGKLSVDKAPPNYSSFLSGLLITLGDPGAILFYMGLLPTFVDLTKISPFDALTIVLMASVIIGIVLVPSKFV